MIPVCGSYAVDGRDGRVGKVMGCEGPYVQLRPPGGGREWDCPPEAVRPVGPRDELWVKVAELNRASRMLP